MRAKSSEATTAARIRNGMAAIKNRVVFDSMT